MMNEHEKNYRYRPLEYARCATCGQECRRRGRDPWVHFGRAYGPGYGALIQLGKTTKHEPEVERSDTVSDPRPPCAGAATRSADAARAHNARERGTRMASDKGYQGWKNYETWSVALIVDNDRNLYEERRRRTREAWTSTEEDFGPYADRAVFTRSQSARFLLADDLKSWVRDSTEGMTHVGEYESWGVLLDQLLGAAMDEVDWNELADRWLNEETNENGEGGYEDEEAQRQREAVAP